MKNLAMFLIFAGVIALAFGLSVRTQAAAVSSGPGTCYSTLHCQGQRLGHMDYGVCRASGGNSWQSDQSGFCY